ncbi:MAG: pseudouridine synthase [Parachlamydia sp.]|nr:MAG: pseudouridine synthase [Parachlamydia sp.]
MAIWKVTSTEAGMHLTAFLKKKFQDRYSAKQLKRALEHNLCQVNKRLERFASTTLAEGDCIECDEARLTKLFAIQNPFLAQQNILYEDTDLFVYDKPAGIACDAEGIVKMVQQSNPHLKLIHRLDKETTGVLLFAKNEDILQRMISQFKEFKVQKTYHALVDGLVRQSAGVIDNFLAPLYKYQGQTVWGKAAKGSRARTEWEKLKQGYHNSLLMCRPITGVTHQIRVHMQELGHPILGDYQYGKHFECTYRPLRHMLHASEITFPHPRTGKILQIKSPFPSDFLHALKELNCL